MLRVFMHKRAKLWRQLRVVKINYSLSRLCVNKIEKEENWKLIKTL